MQKHWGKKVYLLSGDIMMKNAVFPLLSAEKSMLSSDIRFLQKSDSKTDSLLLRERRMVSFTCAGVASEKILYSFLQCTKN